MDSRNEARKLCWGDTSLQKDFEGKEYLTWICERGSKTRNGRENETKRAFYPLVFENSTDRCSIKFYKIFMIHRPKESCNSESPFFLAVRQKLELTEANLVPTNATWKEQAGRDSE